MGTRVGSKGRKGFRFYILVRSENHHLVIFLAPRQTGTTNVWFRHRKWRCIQVCRFQWKHWWHWLYGQREKQKSEANWASIEVEVYSTTEENNNILFPPVNIDCCLLNALWDITRWQQQAELGQMPFLLELVGEGKRKTMWKWYGEQKKCLITHCLHSKYREICWKECRIIHTIINHH